MVYNVEKDLIEVSPLEKASPYLQVIALFGIPGAGCVALALLPQIPLFASNVFALLSLIVEIGSLACIVLLVLVLRACLKLPGAPAGFYRNVLDFLAMGEWHSAVKVALAGMIVLPGWWFFHADHSWLFSMLRILGSKALQSEDVQSELQRFAVAYQLALTGGVPLLFGLHMISRWKPKIRILPWALVPLLFVGAAIGVVLLVLLIHS